ncbi:nucleoside hydrolase [Devosia sp. A16]|uniref:nucleoside hydrolase n=1 Tax=Devosia sp. A16 TaxID=1736675 RepID=UPI0006D80561|nr:nucleoside hydrolase [Devosia sp. A16]
MRKTFLRALMSTTAAALLAVPATAAPFIIDNDFSGPGGSDLQTVLFFLDSPDDTLLGLTVVTGDDWMNAEAAHLLRFLEIAGRTDIPVHEGAVLPLINTPQRLSAWEASYGRLGWKGAWNKPETDGSVPGFDPTAVPELDEGAPTTKAAAGSAAAFLIEQAHKFPGEVTIIAAGPLTNLALATRLDPEFPRLIKKLVITSDPGANFRSESGEIAGFGGEFNVMFDPEAARIVLTAPFASIVSVGPVTEALTVDAALIADIAAKGTPLAAYLAQYAWKDLPLWDEIATAVAIDPSLVQAKQEVLVNVDLAPGATLGTLVAYAADKGPGLGERPITVVTKIDTTHFRQMLLDAIPAK